MDCNQLVLGTAQLGTDYGIAYKSKKIPSKEFQLIMDLARDSGINAIDTAMAYGDSQKVLGQIGVNGWSITSKLCAVPNNISSIDKWFYDSIEIILQELNIRKIDTLLIHDVKELFGIFGRSIIKLMHSSKLKGYVTNIGVSIYAPEDLNKFYNDFQPDVVQCPYNIFDQRILTSGWLDKLTSDNVEVHARSIFLQGLVLRDISELNLYFNPWLSYFNRWESYCRENNISKLQAALGFAKSEKRIKKIIVGIENCYQLGEIIKAYSADINHTFQGSCEDIDLLNPLMWKIVS